MNEESFLPFRGGNGGGPKPMPYLPARGRNGGPVYLLIIGKLREWWQSSPVKVAIPTVAVKVYWLQK